MGGGEEEVSAGDEVTPGSVVRERLLVISTSAATRVYALVLPQDLTTFPAVRVQQIPAGRDQHLRGPDYPVKTRVQVDSYAKTLAAAEQLAAEVRGDGLGDGASGLFGWRGLVGSPADLLVLNVEQPRDGQILYEYLGAQRLVRILDEYVVHWTHMN